MTKKVDSPTIKDGESKYDENGNEIKPPEPKLVEVNVDDYGELFSQSNSDIELQTLSGIHGMPYQFMSNVDLKLSEIDSAISFPYGRKFTERIINRMPLLLISPGKPEFLDGYGRETQESILKKATSVASGMDDGVSLEDIVGNKNGRYYTFRFDYVNYYNYVNGMCWSSSKLLGIDNKEFMHGKTYSEFPWESYANDGLKGFFSGSEYVCFYVDSDDQVSDNFSNQTGESMLANKMNSLSDLGKEVGFLVGTAAGQKIDQLDGENYEATFEQISGILGGLPNPGGVMEKLKEGAVTIAGGGGLIFPEIWQDSDYSKSYSVNIKLNSPDGDTESIYRNILVPMWHLLALALPRQMGANGYESPFLIKAFYKGLISCEMGMVTSMTIQKGREGSWNVDGLPTEVEISMDFKDLYQILTMTKWNNAVDFMNNTPFLDFIANSCGVILNKPELLRKVDMYGMLFANKVKMLPRGITNRFSQKVSNVLMKGLGM